MALQNATEVLVDASRVACQEAREAVTRSVSVRTRARATVRESRRLRATATFLRHEVWILGGAQVPGP